MKKIVSLIAVLLLVVFCLTACSEHVHGTGTHSTQAIKKGADYLYDWMTQHGTLVGGTCLQYSDTDESGKEFTLCYDTGYVEKYRWQMRCITTDTTGHTIITTLYCHPTWPFDRESSISVYGCGKYEDYYRSLQFYHDPEKFTKNSPIECGELGGSTVHAPDSEEALIKEILTLNDICEDRAQTNLCLILDWLKNSFCPTAKMSMSDFGYDKY